MEKLSQSAFATAMLSAVRILTQILTPWLVITSKWNTRVLLPVLNPLYFQVRGSEPDTFPCIENSYVQSCGMQDE